jgi:hypothetical protein
MRITGTHMAKKITPRKNQDASVPGAEDLEILHPERTIHISGRKLEVRPIPIAGRDIEVREYGFLAGLKIQSAVAPIVEALAELAAEKRLELDGVLEIVGEHPEELTALLAAATDLKPAEIEVLPDDEGQLLLLTWWAVNSGFFVRRVAMRATARIARARPAGPTSTPPSSPTTTTPNGSASTAGES